MNKKMFLMNTIDLPIQFSDKKNIKVCIRKGRKGFKANFDVQDNLV